MTVITPAILMLQLKFVPTLFLTVQDVFFVQAGGEEFAVAYENTYKMPIVVTHTMNVFGERQNPEKFIPGVVSAVREGKQVRTLMVRMTMIVLNQITIHSDTTRTIPGSRHYIHVKDVVDGLMFILSLPRDYKHKGVKNAGIVDGKHVIQETFLEQPVPNSTSWVLKRLTILSWPT